MEPEPPPKRSGPVCGPGFQLAKDSADYETGLAWLAESPVRHVYVYGKAGRSTVEGGSWNEIKH